MRAELERWLDEVAKADHELDGPSYQRAIEDVVDELRDLLERNPQTDADGRLAAVARVVKSAVHILTDYERGRFEMACEVARAIGGVEGFDKPYRLVISASARTVCLMRSGRCLSELGEACPAHPIKPPEAPTAG